jgi:flavodoxin I
MTKIGIFYGSLLENTKEAAENIKAELEAYDGITVDIFDIAHNDVRKMEEYELLLVGCPTWNVGQLQSDWEDAEGQIAQLDLRGKRLALFGCGDQGGYPDTFQDAIGILAKAMRKRGASLVGYWPTEGYDFYESLGVEDGKFMGLALDNDVQDYLTNERIREWVRQIVGEFELA